MTIRSWLVAPLSVGRDQVFSYRMFSEYIRITTQCTTYYTRERDWEVVVRWYYTMGSKLLF